MDLPEDKGTYIPIAHMVQMKRLEIGSLGEFDVIPGFYAYVSVRLVLAASVLVSVITWNQPQNPTLAH